MKPRYVVEHTEPQYKIPAVTGKGNPTFDQQQYRMKHVGDDGVERTVKHVRIIRDRKTRPLWVAYTDEPRYQDQQTIALGVTLAEAQAITIDYFTRLMQSDTPPVPGKSR